MRFYEFIDAIIYFLLFLSIGQIAFLKAFANNKKEAKTIAVAVALALTFSMVMLETYTSFYLGKLEPIALIVFLLILAMLLYNLLLGLFTGDNAKNVSASLTYLIIYGLMVVPFGRLYQWIDQNVPLLSGVLALAAITAFIYLLIQMFKLFGGAGTGSTTGPTGPQGPQGAAGQVGPAGNLGPVGPQGNLGGTGVGTNNNNTLTITSPQAYSHHLPRTNIPVSFNVAGQGFAANFDYNVRLNNQDHSGRVRNVNGQTINYAPFNNLVNTGGYMIEITAYQPNTDTVLVRANLLFFIDAPQAANNRIEALNRLLTILQARASEYADLSRLLVQLHRGQVQNRVEDPQMWTALHDLHDRLINGIADFNQGMNNLFNDPTYPNLTAQDLEVIYIAFQRFAFMCNAFMIYYQQFGAAYNNNNAPLPNNPFRQ